MRVIAAALLAGFLALAAGGAAAAVTAGGPLSPAGVRPAAAEMPPDRGPVAEAWRDTLVWVRVQQRDLTRELARAVRAVRDEETLAAAWSLLVVSFLYGVFHAAGPGHGKAVISTYLLTHRTHVARGLALAWASALMQGVVAVALVEGLVHLAGFAASGTRDAIGPLETASFALVAALGLWLAARAGLALARAVRAPAVPAYGFPAGHPHDHPHDHDAHAGCGHAHGPTGAEIARLSSWRAAVPVVVSVGIRPCSGAVVVLLVAEALGLRAAGIGAVLAMAVGTALAVSALALATVYFRQLATLFLRGGGRGAALAGHLVGLAGGLAILLLGLALFAASLGPQAGPPI